MYLHYTRKILDKAISIINKYDDNLLSQSLNYQQAETIVDALQNVIVAIKNSHPYEAELLTDCIQRGFIVSQPSQKYKFNLCIFGEVVSLLSVLNGLYYESPKIFIKS